MFQLIYQGGGLKSACKLKLAPQVTRHDRPQRSTDVSDCSRVREAFGLKATEAVEKWRFRPGQKDGKAVATQATIEVSFRLF